MCTRFFFFFFLVVEEEDFIVDMRKSTVRDIWKRPELGHQRRRKKRRGEGERGPREGSEEKGWPRTCKRI